MARSIGLLLATCLASAGCLADIPEAVPLGYCASLGQEAEFCADFDTVANVADGWSEPEPESWVRLSLDSERAVSPERSARIELVEAPHCSYAQLNRELAGSVSDLVYGFDVFPEVELSGYYVAALYYRGVDADCTVLLSLSTASDIELRLQRHGVLPEPGQLSTVFDAPDTSTPPWGRWSRVELTMELSAPGSPRFGVKYNGEDLGSWQPDPGDTGWLPYCDAAPEPDTLHVRVGSHCMELDAVTNFDNVTVRTL